MAGIVLGFLVNVTGMPVPGILGDALDLMVRAALFGLGDVLFHYCPEGDMATIGFICAISLVLHPAIVWSLGSVVGLSTGQFRSAVLTAAMAPGVNTYIFAGMYGAARRVVASAVLIGTAASLFPIWVGLAILP